MDVFCRTIRNVMIFYFCTVNGYVGICKVPLPLSTCVPTLPPISSNQPSIETLSSSDPWLPAHTAIITVYHSIPPIGATI